MDICEAMAKKFNADRITKGNLTNYDMADIINIYLDAKVDMEVQAMPDFAHKKATVSKMSLEVWPMAEDEYNSFVRGIVQYASLMGKQYHAHYNPPGVSP